ncbi:DUF423 domain-containing protein [Cohnella thailandensis]|uniref:DUF423 domain-containing protein n=1 Tax=Cohnella thailandensis TaxID=557557 RepID=A0A841SRI8_9BACL|nr:DUF423 domain-containing protein [Cohnella thailandensis]MBB6633822.1 DUF423 domain-containing protein [Cohnella thailandensis]MBP1972505.1 uncharacterized membrane protein YgdD (TMEM256/DUF423 family) [Cohnella thailandensis]
MVRKYAMIGAFVALLAVVLGAFGAHMLEERISEDDLKTFETGVRYQMYHGLGILLVALLGDRFGSGKNLLWAGRLLVVGVILFSGSLYGLSLTGLTFFGPITPLGGASFIAGWICAILGARKTE